MKEISRNLRLQPFQCTVLKANQQIKCILSRDGTFSYLKIRVYVENRMDENESFLGSYNL